MFTAFYQGYLLIVGVCALFCLLVNVYNFFFHITQGLRRRSLDRKIEKMTRGLTSLDGKDDQTAVRFSLKSGRDLRALYETMDKLNWSQAKDVPPKAREAIDTHLKECCTAYKRYSDPQCALLIILSNRMGLRTTGYQQFLIKEMEKSPLYLRIQALRGCVLQGDEEIMMKTMESISSQDGTYTIKMITDLLMLYRGDLEQLLMRMLRQFDRYSENLSSSVINAAAAKKMEKCAPDMLLLTQDTKVYLECRIAAIKYFGSVAYEPAEPILGELLFTEDWECGAVAARALSNYGCAAVGNQLLMALTSRNWYVRYNSAMTLATCRPDLVEAALQHLDPYARDIMEYALNTSKGGR